MLAKVHLPVPPVGKIAGRRNGKSKKGGQKGWHTSSSKNKKNVKTK